MTQSTQYGTRRLELLKEVGDKIHEIENGIREKQAAINQSRLAARHHAEFHRHHEAQQETAKASGIMESIRQDEAVLRNLRQKREFIDSGNHPELAALFSLDFIRTNDENHEEVANALRSFESYYTPQLKAAAKRLAVAMKTAAPLLPVPSVVEMIAKEA